MFPFDISKQRRAIFSTPTNEHTRFGFGTRISSSLPQWMIVDIKLFTKPLEKDYGRTSRIPEPGYGKTRVLVKTFCLHIVTRRLFHSYALIISSMHDKCLCIVYLYETEMLGWRDIHEINNISHGNLVRNDNLLHQQFGVLFLLLDPFLRKSRRDNIY